jgi:hypothetical protein
LAGKEIYHCFTLCRNESWVVGDHRAIYLRGQDGEVITSGLFLTGWKSGHVEWPVGLLEVCTNCQLSGKLTKISVPE